MGFDLTWVEILLVTLAIGAGAALQGSLGYGMSLIAVPVLVLIDPGFVPGSLMIIAFTLSVLTIIRERRSLNFKGLEWAVAGRVLGALIAAWLLTAVPEDVLVLLSGVFILLAAAITGFGLRVSPTRLNLGIAGLLAGVMGTVAAIGGPPLALVYQREPGDRIRTSLSGFFIAGTLISMVTLILVGRFGVYQVKLAMLALPGALLGFLLSSRLLPWLDSKYTRPAVLIVASITALIVIINQLI